MKKIFKDILNGIKNSLNRFPQTIAISAVCVIFLIYISEISSGANGDFIESLDRVTMVIALGVPLSLCINLFFETANTHKRVSIYATYFVGAIVLVLYYFFFLMDIKIVAMSRYIALSLILYLIFLFISYFPNRQDFELFVVRVFTRFFTTVLYSLVLYLGLAAILFTIDKLLGINIRSQLYYYTFLIVAGIFAPSFFLAGLPTKNEILSLNDYSRLLNVLVLYIIMPLLSVYSIILYIFWENNYYTTMARRACFTSCALVFCNKCSGSIFHISIYK